MTTFDKDLMRGLAQLGPDGALQTLRAIGRQLNARERTLTMGERQLLGAAVDLGEVEPTTRVTGKKKRKPQTASEALAKLEKKNEREYGTWNLYLKCVRLLNITASIPDDYIDQFVQDKINGGCPRYNPAMARANLLRMALGPIKKQHDALINSLMDHACAEADCTPFGTPLTKKAADDLLTEEWVGALDDRFDVLWDDARAACAALGKPARASTTAASPKKRGADSGGASASPAKKGKKAKTKK